MTDLQYAELHCHSVFSLLDGASEPEALVARAHAHGYTALALTDHDELGGAVRFAQAAREAGLPGILGSEITLRIGERNTHIVLLAESREGYGNITSLITRARLDQPRGEPTVSLDVLARHSAGIYALSGCTRGWVPSLLADGDPNAACEAAAALHDIFPRRFAIEVWDHHLPEERHLVRQLIPLARSLDLPWVVTNNVHYAHPTGRLVQDVLASIRHRRTLDDMGTRLRPNGEWYMKSPAQIYRRWQRDTAGIRMTTTIAERCVFRLADLKPTLPTFPLPPGVSADEYLERLVEQGARERWGATFETLSDRHQRIIRHELGLISKLGLAGYFLIVWDIVRFARREGVLCQGRGSAANSAVCYCLAITAVDPVKLELLFERFLSAERTEAPDIDIDFAHRDREKVLQYVYTRYGREHAAMVCEQITYRGRSAVRDAARVLGFSVQQANALSALSDRFSARATAESLRVDTTVEQALGKYYDIDPQSDRPAVPNDPRRRPEDWSAEELLAERHGQTMMPGTQAAQRLREEKNAARAAAAARSGRPEAASRARDERSTGAVPSGSVASSAQQLSAIPTTQKTSGATAGGRTSEISATGKAAASAAGKTSTKSAVGKTSGAPTARTDNNAAAEQVAETILSQAGLDPNDRRVRVLADIVDGLHQAPRHRSIHVGGFVLTAEPLRTVVPIEAASMPGRTVIQWERDDLDAVGLVKIDLLGLGMLTVLQDCLLYIRLTRGVSIDLGQLDMTDQAVYDVICAADTIGVFQVESRAQMNTLPRLKPRCFYDLVVEVALIRPGPIQGEMVHPYLRRRAGEEPITYPHPSLEPALKRTLGIPLFQEQGMQVAIAAAGFTPGEADILRRAMGHKRSRERMAAICERLIAGMAKNGISEDIARRIYNQINAFADYGFPESHAASFALIVYASAYLRHYYAPEFTAAILNAQPMGFYSVGTLIEDAKRHGVIVLPVDLTVSAWDTSVERLPHTGTEAQVNDRRITWLDPARAVASPASPARRKHMDAGGGDMQRKPTTNDGVRNGAVVEEGANVRPVNTREKRSTEVEQGVVDVRRTNDVGEHRTRSSCAPPPPPHPSPLPTRSAKSPAQAQPRVRLGLRLVRGLGAVAREKLEAALADGPFVDIADVVDRAQLDNGSLRHLAESGAFDGMVTDVPVNERRRAALWRVLEAIRGDAGPLAPSRPRRTRPPLPPMTQIETTDADYRMTGLSLNGHPMRHLRALLAPNGVQTTADLFAHGRDGTKVAHAGLVICRQRPGTAKGFVFLSLEDETGILNVVVTPKRFEKHALLISTSPLLLIRGTLQVEGRVVNLRGEQFKALTADAGERWARSHDFH